ncbi:hypothetical protein A3K86_20775 [Photobacterium jeanii]|uniref:Uncharacterized protein n=1 Tax=Photobacterium jeanii TaxID=858640 RepID=A0A178K3T0_9GAMM|nr:hypothetical protein [Photobacterium jeanii]OAN11382.1 hypothetical protein A3K86_20775 [Photobacterium jeanii]PST90903.1 hypothetical protein C9I91_09880 [Photobacterium jeanii]
MKHYAICSNRFSFSIAPLFLVLGLSFSANSLATTPTNSVEIRTAINLSWFSGNYQHIETSLLTQDTDSVLPLINTLGEIWLQRDGAISGEVSPLLAQAIIMHPEVTLAVLSSHPNSYQKWVERELNGMLFTAQTDKEKLELEMLQGSLAGALADYIPTANTQLKPYAQSLLTAVEASNIRIVD